MIGTVTNTCAILVGTSIGCLLRSGLKEKYRQVLFLAMGLAAFGIGLENLTNAMPKSHYHVLFIVSLAIGALLGTWWQIDKKFSEILTAEQRERFTEYTEEIIRVFADEDMLYYIEGVKIGILIGLEAAETLADNK